MQIRSALTICLLLYLGIFQQQKLLAEEPPRAASDSQSDQANSQRAKAIAEKILVSSTPGEEREKLIAEHVELAPQLIAAMTADLKPDSPDQYDRIPWIWRVAITASRRNQGKQLRQLLEVATPQLDAPLLDWQAVVLGGGIINALSEKGLWPGGRIDEIIGRDEQLARRWRRALELSSAMADDEKVPNGTRYDALRMIPLEGWQRRGEQLKKYLAKGVNDELQMGAVSGVADINSPEATEALIAALGNLSDHNRKLAWQGLLRSEERGKQVLAAIDAGKIKQADIPGDAADRLKSLADKLAADAAIPKGEVTKHTFDQSEIFPGTVRDYWVYVPKQYDPATPACVYVNQDGVQFNAPAVFDRLIHEKQMPVTIGVFVMHGRVKASSDQALDRFNRSYEYDGLGDNYARFLLDELLPHVAREHNLNLSTRGNDRGIGGSSSGAICAFTAAWERPDAFRRVFSAIGTYVGLRGGNEYATLVRKTEPKPIRIFLQDGRNDLNIYGGDWWMANQEIERALTFAGYEVAHEWGDGGHNNEHGTKVFPEAMKFLWKDWPEPIKPGRGSPQLKEIVMANESWTPAQPNDAISQRLAHSSSHKLTRHNGDVYEASRRSLDAEGNMGWAIKGPGSSLTGTPIKEVGGLCLSPDQSLLYVSDSASHWVYSYQIQPDGSLAHAQRYYHLHVPDNSDDSGAGGMCVDINGRLYIATRMGVQVCDQAGRVNCILPTPAAASQICFGGDDRSTLFVTSGEKIFARKLKTTGAQPDQPNKPSSPRL